MSLRYADEARATVLSFFDAPPSEYTVVFTQNASAALKLVGESYPFSSDSAFVLGADSHNSVHGIREFARKRQGNIAYIPSTSRGGFDPDLAKVILSRFLRLARLDTDQTNLFEDHSQRESTSP
jgi:molybdenum cofactor sulfurtransferase